ncbi:MAG: DNA repair protein RadC [Gammaproteobacteria bacterium]
MPSISSNLVETESQSLDYSQAQRDIISEAIGILETMLVTGEALTSSAAVKQFCQLQIAEEKDEHFCCLFLDNQHNLIRFEKLFRGTVNSASVHPRAVVRLALELNAAAVIFTHNHPSGMTTPSQADKQITQRLKEALELVDVRVLDHIVVGFGECTSFAEAGLL